MSPIFGYVLMLVSLLHLWLQGVNRHYLHLPQGPQKGPLMLGWFACSFLLPSLLIALFREWPPVAEALSFAPYSFPSMIIFSATLALHAFTVVRCGMWMGKRARLRNSSHVQSEEVTIPRLENRVTKLPGVFAALDTTTALEVIRRDIVVPDFPPEFDSLTIAQVSDLHFDPRSGLVDYLEEVVEITNALRPDIVVFTGDFVNAARHIRRSVSLHERFHARLGKFAVLGNHDYWTRPERVKEALGRTDIVYLGGSRRTFSRGGRNLVLAGTDHPWSGCEDDWRVLLRKGSADCVILISHAPEVAPIAARHGANLVLSGHCHGGQVCLPIVGPIIVPSKLGHRFTSGVYDVTPDCLLNVSRGIGVSTGGFRLHCPPEVTLLRLRASFCEATVGAVRPARARLVSLRSAELPA